MSGFPKKARQKIIDDYLADTSRNLFIAGEFIDWLEQNPDHEAFQWFFGKDDATLARERRIDMAREMASGLRIVVKTEVTGKKSIVQITTKEYPAYVSPVSSRKAGGGYYRFDPNDVSHIDELTRQGAMALRSWLERYRGVAEAGGFDVSAIEKIAVLMEGRIAEAA